MESRVVIRSVDGDTLNSINHASPRGMNGYYVDTAEWSPDSQFFVYSMVSSGGHSPWSHPTVAPSGAAGARRPARCVAPSTPTGRWPSPCRGNSNGWRSRGNSPTSSRSRLRCGHRQPYVAPRSAARHAARPRAAPQNVAATCLPSIGPGRAWPPLPCSDRLPRRSARSGLSEPAPAPSSAASSATSVRHALHRSMSGRQVAGPPSDPPSLLQPPSLAQRRESTANL
jgi:hypothetical protein